MLSKNALIGATILGGGLYYYKSSLSGGKNQKSTSSFGSGSRGKLVSSPNRSVGIAPKEASQSKKSSSSLPSVVINESSDKIDFTSPTNKTNSSSGSSTETKKESSTNDVPKEVTGHFQGLPIKVETTKKEEKKDPEKSSGFLGFLGSLVKKTIFI